MSNMDSDIKTTGVHVWRKGTYSDRLNRGLNTQVDSAEDLIFRSN